MKSMNPGVGQIVVLNAAVLQICDLWHIAQDEPTQQKSYLQKFTSRMAAVNLEAVILTSFLKTACEGELGSQLVELFHLLRLPFPLPRATKEDVLGQRLI